MGTQWKRVVVHVKIRSTKADVKKIHSKPKNGT
jgi:hypothetical protein